MISLKVGQQSKGKRGITRQRPTLWRSFKNKANSICHLSISGFGICEEKTIKLQFLCRKIYKITINGSDKNKCSTNIQIWMSFQNLAQKISKCQQIQIKYSKLWGCENKTESIWNQHCISYCCLTNYCS